MDCVSTYNSIYAASEPSERTAFDVSLNDGVISTVGEWILNVNLYARSVRYLFKNWDELVHYLGRELGFDFNTAISIVWNRVNWNRCVLYKGTKEICSYNKSTFWNHPSFLDIMKVERVINFYVNESLKPNSTLAEYKPENSDTEKLLIKTIANGAGVLEKEAREIMTQSFFAFKDGQLPDDFITRPRQWMKHKDSRAQNENADSITNAGSNIFDGFLTVLKWVGIAVGVGAVIYFTAPVWSSKK